MEFKKLIKSLLDKILLEEATDEEINLYLRITTVKFYNTTDVSWNSSVSK